MKKSNFYIAIVVAMFVSSIAEASWQNVYEDVRSAYIDEVKIHFYKAGKKQPEFSLELGEDYKIAHVFSVVIQGQELEGMEYTFEMDGKEYADIYARKITGMEKWNIRTKKE